MQEGAHDFNRYAGEYDTRAQVQLWSAKRLLSLLPALPEGLQVLDVGAGTGMLSRLMPQHHFTNMDYAYKMLQSCPKDDTAWLADVNTFPKAPVQYDLVVSNFALHWTKDLYAAVKYIRSLLKPGGYYAIALPVVGSLPELAMSIGSERMHLFSEALPVQEGDSYNEIETQLTLYPSFKDALYAVKGVGGSLKRRRTYRPLTKGRLKEWENYYCTHFATEDGLPLTWRVQFVVGKI